MLWVLAQRENTAVGQQLLVSQARLEAFADGFRAREEQNDQVVRSSPPGIAHTEPEMPVAGFCKRRAPEAAQGIARRPSRSIGKHCEIRTDVVTERLDVQAECLEGIDHTAGPCTGHSQARIGLGLAL